MSQLTKQRAIALGMKFRQIWMLKSVRQRHSNQNSFYDVTKKERKKQVEKIREEIKRDIKRLCLKVV
ncbi:hypothetical protein DRP05_05285 [Archaeoglobales archaeon]|nr:MAG: hypothetical protein DRP05_05285 [Archaeoglobales archaeon]